jgi:adenylate cyclase
VVQAKGVVERKWRKTALALGAVLAIFVAAAVAWNLFLRPAPRLEDVASVERMAFPLPNKPSIAVLPFVNMSGDPQQEFFSDGISEQIISSISKIPGLFVIARNSTFTYKGRPVKVQKVAEDLNVRYVLEGSVQRSGERVRITVQLIDTITGHHLWSERYDRDLKEIFALQDEITMNIITSLQVKLTLGEQARARYRATNSLEAYEKYLQGVTYFRRRTKGDNILARKLLEEVIVLDPDFAMAYVYLGWTYLTDIAFGWSESPDKDLALVYELGQKALALEDSLAEIHVMLSGIHLRKGEVEKTIALRERAVALDPNSADCHALLAIALAIGGRAEEAIKVFQKAISLNPLPPDWYLSFLGMAYYLAGQYERAIETYKGVINRNPDYWLAHRGLAFSYALSGRDHEARTAAAEVNRLNPQFSFAHWVNLYFKNQADRRRLLGALEKAGVITENKENLR